MLTLASATQIIQAILAPAVMVSASALFLLGLNARYVAIFTRVRLLNDEKRELGGIVEHRILSKAENDRLLSIEEQLNRLVRTAWYIRNSIISHVTAALFFLLTSCFLGLTSLLGITFASDISVLLFVIGLLSSLSGIVFTGMDIFNSYSVLLIEISKGRASKN